MSLNESTEEAKETNEIASQVLEEAAEGSSETVAQVLNDAITEVKSQLLK